MFSYCSRRPLPCVLEGRIRGGRVRCSGDKYPCISSLSLSSHVLLKSDYLTFSRTPEYSSSRIHSPWSGGYKSWLLHGLSYRPARLRRLASRYYNPMPESTISPIQGQWIWPQGCRWLFIATAGKQLFSMKGNRKIKATRMVGKLSTVANRQLFSVTAK